MLVSCDCILQYLEGVQTHIIMARKKYLKLCAINSYRLNSSLLKPNVDRLGL